MDRVGGGGEGRPGGHNVIPFHFLLPHFSVKGDEYTGPCAQRTDEGDGFPSVFLLL
jgi:hypothetical protein